MFGLRPAFSTSVFRDSSSPTVPNSSLLQSCEIVAIMVSTADQFTESRTEEVFRDYESSINSAIFEILPENIPNTIITKTPEERFRLGYWSVIALVVNRVIGKSFNFSVL